MGIEIKDALISMSQLKAQALDGYPVGFFQKYWDMVGPSVTQYTLDILEGKKDIKEINHSFIVLIPKQSHPKEPSHFRPKSLYNIIYKVVAKVLANRLKGSFRISSLTTNQHS